MVWRPHEASNEIEMKARVIYVAGDSRSGTTLLSRVLGSFERCIAVGELYDIWNKSIQGYTLCSCGTPFLECGFWNAVMREAFGDDGADPARMVALRQTVQGMRHVPFMLFPRLRTARFEQNLREYVSTTERLYLAIQKVSGCDVIVDSSKMASYALALSESPRIDVSLVHITRDSRACVFSWRRLKREATAGGQSVFLPQRPVMQTALVWALRNSVLRAVARRFPHAEALRYEDLVRHPREVIIGLVEKFGLDSESVTWASSDEMISTKSNHIFAGNPNRVEQGQIRFRADDEWRTGMPPVQKGIVTALTCLALWWLGYLGRRHS